MTSYIQALTSHLGNASHGSSPRTMACGFQYSLASLLGKRSSACRLPMSRSLWKWEDASTYLLRRHHGFSFSVFFQQCLVPGVQCRQCYSGPFSSPGASPTVLLGAQLYMCFWLCGLRVQSVLSTKNLNLNKNSKYKMYVTVINTIGRVSELKRTSFIQTELYL